MISIDVYNDCNCFTVTIYYLLFFFSVASPCSPGGSHAHLPHYANVFVTGRPPLHALLESVKPVQKAEFEKIVAERADEVRLVDVWLVDELVVRRVPGNSYI